MPHNPIGLVAGFGVQVSGVPFDCSSICLPSADPVGVHSSGGKWVASNPSEPASADSHVRGLAGRRGDSPPCKFSDSVRCRVSDLRTAAILICVQTRETSRNMGTGTRKYDYRENEHNNTCDLNSKRDFPGIFPFTHDIAYCSCRNHDQRHEHRPSQHRS